MTKDEFLLRFNLLPLAEDEPKYIHNAPLRSAAVLIGLVEPTIKGDKANQANKVNTDTGLQVILTKRASHLKHHPSQISFPGGKVENADKSLIDTALREAFEEIGLSRDAVTILGTLPSYQTVSGFSVFPIVATIAAPPVYNIDKNEVSEVFHVPLQHFLQAEDHHIMVSTKEMKQHKVHFYTYDQHTIWGITAAMLKNLVLQLK
jgi:8-oxo-dGTP pyrophosphatase MutT (NUDIX family)